MSHYRLDPIEELPDASAGRTTLSELLSVAREHLGGEAVLEFDSELDVSMTCDRCGEETPVLKRMARLYEQDSVCPHCGEKREMNLTHRISGEETFLDRTMAEIDVPPLGIIRARNDQKRIYYELTGDRESFLKFE